MTQAPGVVSLAEVWLAAQWRPAWRALLVVFLVFVGVMALSPVPPLKVGLGWDKLNHAFAFLVLGVVGLRAFPGPRSRRVVLAGLWLYGGAIELAQLHVPGRSAEWADLAADTTGIALAAWVVSLATRRFPALPD